MDTTNTVGNRSTTSCKKVYSLKILRKLESLALQFALKGVLLVHLLVPEFVVALYKYCVNSSL